MKVVAKTEMADGETRPFALPDHLPIGSPVTLYLRRIPAHAYSQLKYQAVYLQKGIFNNAPDLDPFLSIELESVENIYQTLSMLDQNFEMFKKISRLHLECATGLTPVPLILNCLPIGWDAKIIKSLNKDAGVIRISKLDQTRLVVPGQDYTCKALYAIFHVDDVTVSPALKHALKPGMASIVGSQVDLRARSLAMVEGPGEILAEVNKFLHSYEHQEGVITLQAIQVFIKRHPAEQIPKDLPRPTVLRASCGTFNSLVRTPFFCNNNLRINMDTKLADVIKFDVETNARNVYIRNYYERVLTNHVTSTVHFATGRVIRLISDDFAVGALYPTDEQDGRHAQVLFDVFDVWHGNEICADAGIPLKTLIKVGTYIKFLCLPVSRDAPPQSSTWNFKYLVISLVAATSEEELKHKVLPGSEAHTMQHISQDKVKNFHIVVGHIEKSLLTLEEMRIMREMEFSKKAVVTVPKGLGAGNRDNNDLNRDVIVCERGIIVTIIDDEFGILGLNQNESKARYAVFHRQSIYRNGYSGVSADMSDGKLRKFLRPGFPVKFNAFRIRADNQEDKHNPVNFYASSVNFGLAIDRNLHDTDLYAHEPVMSDNDADSVVYACKSYVKLGLKVLQKYFTNDAVGVDCAKLLKIEFPWKLESIEACVIYKDPAFIILQIDFGKITVNGMFLIDGAEEDSEQGPQLADFVMVNAVLCHPCGGVQYLVNSVSQVC